MSSDNRSRKIRDLNVILLLTVVWIAMVVATNPLGDFPLNDDWVYGQTVYELISHGRLQTSGVGEMTLILHVLWGALFCLLFGFSYTTLRISTLVMGLIGILATYKILSRFLTAPSIAFFCSFLLATNPLYFNCANTFMTDVTFVALSTLGLLFLTEPEVLERPSSVIIGSFFTSLSFFVRQLGIILPFCFTISHLLKAKPGKEPAGKWALMVSLPTMSALVSLGLYAWIGDRFGFPPVLRGAHFVKSTMAKYGVVAVLALLVKGLLILLLYMGLLLLPLLIICRHKISARLDLAGKKNFALRTLLFTCMLGSILVFIGNTMPNFMRATMPVGGNLVYDFGLGPVLLKDTHTLGMAHLPSASGFLWLSITVLSVLGASLLLEVLAEEARNLRKLGFRQYTSKRQLNVMILLASIGYTLLMTTKETFYDRYLLYLIPLSLVFILQNSGRPLPLRKMKLVFTLSLGIALLIACYSICGTHDYLSWNRARWQAIRHLMMEEGVSPNLIDAGYEFNGLYLFNRNQSVWHPGPKSWWWVDKDDYVIAFGPIPGYRTIGKFAYKNWLPIGMRNVYVLRKESQATN
jgi:hypothetical protein